MVLIEVDTDFEREEHAMADEVRMALAELLRKAEEAPEMDCCGRGCGCWPRR